MKAVIQRVLSASVQVNGNRISEIERGLCVLIGIGTDDVAADMDYIVSKILALRLFPIEILDDSPGDQAPVPGSKRKSEPPENLRQWSKNVKEIGGEVLCVSQFTLMAKTKKGNKPDFHNAMGTSSSRELYAKLIEKMKLGYSPDRIKDGEFGAMMQVQITNDGPVTIIVDSKESQSVSQSRSG
ncbi:hypothetical protein CROQUDRAFT_35605 [Cronartium quercuum f. sp. fusiforme G11]|uniref:D-aminoacyl-tRNA deacylase n=1 Tax=Cronartium quercuum f. sp. fusiforme G11 TaxID=708437 RepID=A0A9P6NRP5_9BASI|nr:hypothetical protein CROQUDRAFT_35605 [Cronartium quercuum f. sp. fusiforme G11]